MKQYTFIRPNHQSPRSVIICKDQIVLQSMKENCGCSSCVEQHNAIESALDAKSIKYHIEHIKGTTFIRIYQSSVVNKVQLQEFLEKESGLSIESIRMTDKSHLWPVQEVVPSYGESCGEDAKHSFLSGFVWGTLSDKNSKSLSKVYAAAVAGKMMSEEKLKGFLKRAKKIRALWRKNNMEMNEEQQTEYSKFREDVRAALKY